MAVTSKQQNKENCDLIDSLAQNVGHHSSADKRLSSAIRVPLQQLISGYFSGQGQRGQCVHYQVHPQHLNSLQGTFLHKPNTRVVQYYYLD